MLLDKLDQKLLLELYKDARQSNAQIGKTLLCSKEVIQYRLKRLEENGIITKYIPIINFSRLGYTIYRLQIKFTTKNQKIILTSHSVYWLDYYKSLIQEDLTFTMTKIWGF